jgi:5-methylcytosine-specific restriction endonuclease McrA
MPTPYADKLKDPRWQKRRLEILARDDFACRNCGDGESTLHVDHKVYRRGADPWDYPDDDLQALCESCHVMRKLLKRASGSMMPSGE